MNKQFIFQKKFKGWYKHLDNTHSIMFSDDIDSLFISRFLELEFGCKLDLFNSFSSIYSKEGVDIYALKKGKVVGTDIDLSKGKTFSNHVTYLQNPDCISLNKYIPYGCKEYYSKFAGSTLITVLSLYNYDLSYFTEQQLEILISIDTAFKQYFFNAEIFKEYYNDILQYPIFIDVVRKKGRQYFYDIIKEYGLHEKIYINEGGHLETRIKLDELSKIFDINLLLPQERFEAFYHMQTVSMSVDEFRRTVDEDKIFSSALAGNNHVVASIKY